MAPHRSPSSSKVEDDDYVTTLLCANVDDLDSTEWSVLTDLALTWLSRQSVLRSDYVADSQLSLNDGPWLDGRRSACVGTTTNVDVVRWMIPFHRTEDPVGAMAKAVRRTLNHPLKRLHADAKELDALGTSTSPDMQQSTRMVHYRITKMLIRLALIVRNLGQPRLESPDYVLFQRMS
jgi:hypothetical protein